MAVTQYDRPIVGQFVDTYVPIPFEEMMRVGQAKEQTAVASMNYLNQISSNVADIKYIHGRTEGMTMDEDIIEDIFIPGVEKIVQEAMDDPRKLSDPMVIARIKSQIDKLVPPHKIAEIQASAAKWERGEQEKLYSKRAGTYDPRLDKDKDISQRGYSTDMEGEYSYMSPIRTPIRPMVEELINSLAPTIKRKPDGTTYVDPTTNLTMYEITPERVEALAKENWSGLADSIKGRQELDLAAMEMGLSSHEDLTPEQKEAIVTKWITDAGREKNRELFGPPSAERDVGFDLSRYAMDARDRGILDYTEAREYEKKDTNYKAFVKYNDKLGTDIKNVEQDIENYKDGKASSIKDRDDLDRAEEDLFSLESSLEFRQVALDNMMKDVDKTFGSTEDKIAESFIKELKESGVKTKEEALSAIDDALASSNVGMGKLFDFYKRQAGRGIRTLADTLKLIFTGELGARATLTAAKVAAKILPKGRVPEEFYDALADFKYPDFKKVDIKVGRPETAVWNTVMDLRELAKEKRGAYKAKFDSSIFKSYSEAITYTPPIIMRSGVGYINSMLTGEEEESQIQRLVDRAKLSPQDKKIISFDDRKLDDVMTDFADSEIVVSGIPYKPDENGWYVLLTGTKEDKKGPEKSNYKMYLTDQSQLDAISTDMTHRNRLEEAYKWANPKIAETVTGLPKQKEKEIAIRDHELNRDFWYTMVRNDNNTFTIITYKGEVKGPYVSEEEVIKDLYRLENNSYMKYKGYIK